MMPVIVVTGNAGSGKDTVADILTEKLNAQKIALADPVKRIVKEVFGFSKTSLWGESSLRNIAQQDLSTPEALNEAEYESKHNFHLAKLVSSLFPLKEHQKEFYDNLSSEIFPEIHQYYTNNLSPRVALQLIGTDLCRRISNDVWVYEAQKTVHSLLGGGSMYSPYDGVLYTDPSIFSQMVIISDARFLNEIIGFKQSGAKILKVKAKHELKTVGIEGHPSETQAAAIPDIWCDFIIENDKFAGIESLVKQVDLLVKTYEPKRF